jgi:GT2 family glycosyltransferase
MSKPYLSLVLTGRNDNYGGDFQSRLQNCVTNAFEQLSKAGISSEIIFVNYNPTDDNEPIERFIDWPKSTVDVSIRIITVPNLAHKKLVADGTRKNVPVLEYMGKNAGIRRARGEFILSMNPDIILPFDLVKKLGQLSRDKYYRADRVDFEGNLQSNHRLLRLYVTGHDYSITSRKQIAYFRAKNFLINQWKLFTPKISSLLNRFSVTVYYDNRECRHHCNVSGDFFLMHRDNWHAFHGHAECNFIALHVDSLMVIQAVHSGLKEHIFNAPIFHQEHTRRYDASLPDPQFINAWNNYQQEAKKMEEAQKSTIYNDWSWGLYNFELPELNQ